MALKALTGGERLQRRLAEIAQKVSKRAELRVGFLENTTYKDGTPVALVAAIQEFGAPSKGIPPRPFFRTMIKEKSGGWGDAIGHLLPKKGYDAAATLSALGDGIKAQLEDSIRHTNEPPLSPVTLLLRQRFGNNPQEITFADVMKARHDIAKGVVPKMTATGAKPLVWTGQLLNSVGSEVDK